MKTPTDGVVPDGMPKELGRVHAALDTPIEPAPEALLKRIVASRAAGERRILPVEHAPPSRLRGRLVRGAIAAALGLVALGTWSRWIRPNSAPPAVSSFGFPMGGDFGFGELAVAQGGRTVALSTDEPVTFDTTRLRPMRLLYVARNMVDGTHPVRAPDTIGVFVARSTESGRPWIITTTNIESGGRVRVFHADTTVLSAASLRPLRYSIAITAADGSGQTFRQVFGADTTRMHREFREVRSRPATGGRGASSDTLVTTRDSSYATPPSRWPGFGLGRGALVVNLMAVPIGRGWKRSFVLAVRSDTTISVNIEVVGDERFDSPGGKVDCWKLVMRGSPGYTMLIRKSDGLLVSISGAQTANGKRYGGEMVLIGEQ